MRHRCSLLLALLYVSVGAHHREHGHTTQLLLGVRAALGHAHTADVNVYHPTHAISRDSHHAEHGSLQICFGGQMAIASCRFSMNRATQDFRSTSGRYHPPWYRHHTYDHYDHLQVDWGKTFMRPTPPDPKKYKRFDRRVKSMLTRRWRQHCNNIQAVCELNALAE